ncbi:MAG: hypothetical protein SV186_06695 [Candidatus Nanohaloarchaea archaeon]|nr:hypothetical protein [Candidatus Nanohaloarchaea archaeon]
MADEDVLTFEQLKNLQNKEQDSDTLQELDESFFDRVKDYLDRKQRIGGHLNNKEYRNAKHIVEDILDARQKKIIRLAFLATKSQITVDNLLPEEELLFDRVQESIKEHRSEIEDQLFGEDDAEELGDERPEGDSPGGQQDNSDGSDEETGQDEAEEGGESGGRTEKDETRDDGTVEQEDETDETESDEDSEDGEEADDRDETAEDAGDEDEDGEELLFGSDDSDEDEGGTDDGDEETNTGSQDDSEEADGEELVEVRMTADVTEFMGVDLQPYGPFDEGETAEIPAENAEVLEEQGKAEQQD